ncbi:MAG: phosphatase PAP2 family protein [Chitinispirillaceae bacterium]
MNRSFKTDLFVFATVVILCISSGCSRSMLRATPLESPDIIPSKERMKKALSDAFFDPSLFIGGAALAVFAFSDMDENIASYISDRNLLFGTEKRAAEASDYLRAASLGTAALLYTVKYLPLRQRDQLPYSTDTMTSVPAKYQGPAAGAETLLLSGLLTAGTTELLKRTTGRLRPDFSDYRSFPSGHTSVTAFANNYSANTLSSMSLPHHYQYLAQGILCAATFTTAWARIEARRHYPTDVVAGAMLATFFGNFAYKAFLGPYQPLDTRFDINVTPEGCDVRLAFQL